MSLETREQAPPAQHVSQSETPALPHSITEIETRSDLSPLFKIVRTFMRPLRPRLVQINDVHPAGSPQLKKRPRSHYGVRITERCVQVPNTPEHPLPQLENGKKTGELWLYDFETGNSNSGKREYTKTVYYFAGGGFKAPPSSEHWKLCARMAKDLAPEGIRIVVMSYPLAPNSPAWASLPLLQAWLETTLRDLENDARSNETITLMGDSAGGNIAISLAFYWADRLAVCKRGLEGRDLKVETVKVAELDALRRLTQIIAISPPCDFRNTNPEITDADKMDPILTVDLTSGVADAWTKDFPCRQSTDDPKAHPTLSPNLQTEEAWQALRSSGLRVDGLFGTADVLAPDCKVFMNLCKLNGIKGKWLCWNGQMHCFPLIVAYGVRDGREGFDWLCRRLKE